MKNLSKTYHSLTRKFVVRTQGDSDKYGKCELSGIESSQIVSITTYVEYNAGRYSYVSSVFADLKKALEYINNQKAIIQPEELDAVK